MTNKSIVLGLTGASGAVYGLRTLYHLLKAGLKINLVLSPTAYKVVQIELDLKLDSHSLISSRQAILEYLDYEQGFKNLQLWHNDNLAANIASGSYRTEGMIIAPCSMGALGRIANGTSEDLIARTADVCLKERKKLILLARETPLNAIHLQNMLTITQAGGLILPAMPAFYHKPQNIQELVDFVVGKALDAFGLNLTTFKRWGE